MRETLFRGKRKENGEWVYGNYAVTDNNGKRHFIFQNKAFEFEVVPETVGQYTGIIDDNEKKIFEGDILNVINPDDDDYDYITKVYSECNTLCVDVEGQDYDYTSIGFAVEIWDDECDRVEVIGNIHDNPELLLNYNK